MPAYFLIYPYIFFIINNLTKKYSFFKFKFISFSLFLFFIFFTASSTLVEIYKNNYEFNQNISIYKYIQKKLENNNINKLFISHNINRNINYLLKDQQHDRDIVGVLRLQFEERDIDIIEQKINLTSPSEMLNIFRKYAFAKPELVPYYYFSEGFKGPIHRDWKSKLGKSDLFLKVGILAGPIDK